jgi:hypothetical protein
MKFEATIDFQLNVTYDFSFMLFLRVTNEMSSVCLRMQILRIPHLRNYCITFALNREEDKRETLEQITELCKISETHQHEERNINCPWKQR